jgi:hypothetical protein
MENSDFEQAAWRKSRHSMNTACVEVAETPTAIGVRDTKDMGDGLVLRYSPTQWSAFLEAAKTGVFDYPR